MKNFRIYLACLTVVCMLFTSCSKEEDTALGDDPANKATLSFGAYLNDLVNNKAALKQAVTDLPECTDDTPAFVEVVLTQGEDAVVGTVGDPLRVSVNPNPEDYDGDGVAEYFTEESASLELDPGTYTLTYFTVLNTDGDEIWISPIDDGEPGNFAEFVDNPLPMDIELGAGVKKYVDVEVLCFDDREVNEYGYLFFDIEQHEAFEFCFFANLCPPEENGRHYPAAISVDIWIGDDNTGVQIYNDELNDVGENNDGDFFARPICFALPNLAQFADDEDYFYYEVTVLDWEEAYGDVDQSVIAGTLSRNDIEANFDGDNNVDYEHLRFGCGDEDETPNEDCPGDADCDGIPNEDDVCPGFDDGVDSDGDTVPDGCDVCPDSDDRQDGDNDGIPDGCEEGNPGEDCPEYDTDCDGIPNEDDVCPGFDDGEDADNDGIPDGCDDCPNDASNECDEDDDDVVEGCETAFMMGDRDFLDDMDFGNNRWGWAEFWDDGDETRTFEFWAAAGQNDTSKGTHVGNITIDVDGDEVEITFNMFEGNELELAHIYLDGDEPTTNAPGQYTYDGDDLNYNLEVEDWNASEDFWIIVQGEVCASDID